MPRNDEKLLIIERFKDSNLLDNRSRYVKDRKANTVDSTVRIKPENKYRPETYKALPSKDFPGTQNRKYLDNYRGVVETNKDTDYNNSHKGAQSFFSFEKKQLSYTVNKANSFFQQCMYDYPVSSFPVQAPRVTIPISDYTNFPTEEIDYTGVTEKWEAETTTIKPLGHAYSPGFTIDTDPDPSVGSCLVEWDITRADDRYLKFTVACVCLSSNRAEAELAGITETISYDPDYPRQARGTINITWNADVIAATDPMVIWISMYCLPEDSDNLVIVKERAEALVTWAGEPLVPSCPSCEIDCSWMGNLVLTPGQIAT